MRCARRRFLRYFSPTCIHIKKTDDFIFYCDGGGSLGPDCSEGCPYIELSKPPKLTNRKLRSLIHASEILYKEIEKQDRKERK